MLSLGPLGPNEFFQILILLLQLVPKSATGGCLLAPSQHTLAIFSLSNHTILAFQHRTPLPHRLATPSRYSITTPSATTTSQNPPHPPALLAMEQQTPAPRLRPCLTPSHSATAKQNPAPLPQLNSSPTTPLHSWAQSHTKAQPPKLLYD